MKQDKMSRLKNDAEFQQLSKLPGIEGLMASSDALAASAQDLATLATILEQRQQVLIALKSAIEHSRKASIEVLRVLDLVKRHFAEETIEAAKKMQNGG